MNRTRSTTTMRPTSLDYVESMTYAPYSGKGSVKSGRSSGHSKTISDVNHPNYRKRIARGEVIVGELFVDEFDRSFSGFSVTYSSPSYHANWSGDGASLLENLVSPDVLLDNDLLSMRRVALLKAHAAIRQNSVMAGEIAGEIRSTLEMLRHPFRDALNLTGRMIKSFKAHRGKSTRSAARAFSNMWLEYRYGWKPLILDIHQVYKNHRTFRSRLFKRRLVARASQSGSQNTSKSFEMQPCIPDFGVWKASGTVTRSQEVAAHAGVIYEVQPRSASEQVSVDYRLGADSLLQTAWELTPFSFVVDWFVDVGTWLEAIIPVPGVQILGSWVTTVNTSSTTYSCTGFQGRTDSVITETGTLGSSVHHRKIIERLINQCLPQAPPVNFDFSSLTHAVDGSCLTIQRLLADLRSIRH